jgi:hypothetical protein
LDDQGCRNIQTGMTFGTLIIAADFSHGKGDPWKVTPF